MALGGFAIGLLCYGLGDDRNKVLVVAIGGCVVCLLVYDIVSRLVPRYFALRLLVVSYGLQLLALAAVAVLDLPLGPRYHPFDVNAGDSPIRAVLAMLAVPAGAMMAAVGWSYVSRLARRPDRAKPPEDIASRRRIYLVIAALAHLLYWPAGLENSGALGYIGRVLATGLIWAPFLAGRDSSNDRRLATLWCFTLLVNGVVGIAAGTRAKTLIAVVLFAAGYISAMPKRKRLVAGACSLLAAVPLIQLAGALGVVRDELGRGGLEMVETGHITDVFRLLSQELMGGGNDTLAVKEHGVSRLLAWTNVVVPLMTPETVPYRGLDGFLDEATQTFRIASVSGLTPDDLYDAGLWNAPARQYGFTVNSYTAVEFTLAADGWSRGGIPIALLFSIIAALVMTICESAADQLHPYGAGVSTILTLPVAKAAFFDSNFVPLLPLLRGLALYVFVVAIMVVVVEMTLRTTRATGRTRRITPVRLGVRRG